MDLVTIIINVYNGEKFIEKCIDCCLNQTYKNIEVLIINDGSKDNTLNVIKKYNDKRIRVITTKNMGLALSRNVGIDKAKGKYLYFIDVDDLIEKDTIEYLYNLCIKYNAKMSSCKNIDIYDYNYEYKNEKEKVMVLSNKDMLKMILLYKDRSTTMWNKLIKKDVLNNLRFEDRCINDLAFVYKFVMKLDKIVYSNQIKYFYLKHDESITHKKMHDLNRAIDVYKVSLDRYNYIKNIYPDFIENDLGLIRVIVMLYGRKNKKIHEYLNSVQAYNLLKKLFKYRMLLLDISFKEKVKIFLFKINMKAYLYCMNLNYK